MKTTVLRDKNTGFSEKLAQSVNNLLKPFYNKLLNIPGAMKAKNKIK
jgi:hypothetical protein